MAETTEWTDAYNPFNSMKLFAHVPRWKEIKKGSPLPAPALVTIDPTNVCNLHCRWCNSEYLRNRSGEKISEETLREIADYLPIWGDHSQYRGVPAVCIAGGGEPLVHPYTGKLIKRLVQNDIGVGIVTNGTLIGSHLEELLSCTWVGASVDAGSPSVYQLLKQRVGDRNFFEDVMHNLSALWEKTTPDVPLGRPGRGPGISYKFLMHPENVKDIYTSARRAKEVGCKSLHIRPFGVPWDQVGTGHPDEFKLSDIEQYREEIAKARTLEDRKFRIYAVTHKFDGNFKKKNSFKKCNAVFMTAVVEPPTDPKKGKFNLGLCCDRRGDRGLTIENLERAEQIRDFWGSENHWEMADRICVAKCPRCTYQPHNQIFENVILEDNTTWEFM